MVAQDIIESNRQFNIPRTANTIERGELYDVLGTYDSHRVILLTAPAGYGKTTTVAQFADRSQVPTVWHTVEEPDRDLANLQLHTLQALSAIAPDIQNIYDQDFSPRECAVSITRSIRDMVDEHFLLVLDDLHMIAGALQAEMWLQYLVELLPPKCHLVLISRTVPDLPLAELIAKRTIVAIGQDKLRFNEEEAILFARAIGSNVTAEQVRQRVTNLEGWPAGVAMSLQPLPQEIELSILRGHHGPEALFYTLADMMLQKQTPMLRDFLLSSSVLSRLTPELCSKILDFPNSTDVLALALNRGLFVTQVAGGFVYHRLFRSFLQNHLKRRDPELFVMLHQRAGDWYQDEGEFETAFEHYIAAELIDPALSIVEHTHMAYFSQGKVETLLLWRSKLEDKAIRIPYLLYKCSIIYTERYMYKKAEAELSLAQRAFSLANDEIGLADVELQYMMIMGRRGEYARVVERVTALLGVGGLPDRIVARAKQYLALSYLELGEIEAAIALFETIVPIYEANQDLHALSTVLQDMEVAYTKQGDLDNASRCLQKVVSIRRQLRRPDALALALNNLGYHYHQRHNFKEAIRTLREGLQLVEQTSNRRAESYLLWSMGDVRRDLGDFQAAQQLYNRAYELSSGMEPSLQRAITLSMSTLYRWQGEYALAERLARETTMYSVQPTTLDDWIARARMYIARVYQSDAQQILHELAYCLDNLQLYRTTTEYRLCALYCVLASVLSNNLSKLDNYIADALSNRGGDNQLLAPELLAEIANTPDLKACIMKTPRYRAVCIGLEKLQAEHSLNLPAKMSSPQLSIVHQTYSIYVHTLGSELITCNDTLVPASAWRANRAREFFLYLLFEGPQTRENLSLVFWPDSSPKRVRSNFHTTLYRARQALGDNVVIFDEERYRTNSNVDIVCDALLMEDYVRQARLLQPIDARAEDLYQRALNLYDGDFLTSLDANWVDTLRTNYFEIYIESLLGAGKCARVRQDYKMALAIYQRGLEHDPYREGIHRALFQCYAELGETYQVVTHFRRMKEIFKAELGISPSAETLNLVENLI